MNKTIPPYVSGSRPLVGHMFQFRNDRTELFKRGYEEQGDVFAIKLGPQSAAVVIGPEYQRLFFKQTDKALNIQKPYKFLKAIFDEALFLAPHDVYLKQRPLVIQLFRREKMAYYIQVMQQEVQKWLDSLADEGEIELTEAINLLVQEVAGHCFLGSEVHEQIGREFWDLYADISAALDPLLPPNLPLPKFIRRDRAKKKMRAILRPIITERRQNPEAYNDLLQDVVNQASSNPEELTDDVIINLLLGLMFAGHETTAGQAAWSIIQLLQHPDYRALVQEEIEGLTTHGERFDHRAMAKMKRLLWAVLETGRMKPSADILMRVVEEEIEVGAYQIPKGWLMQVATDVAHNLPELWDNPQQYDPLRYSPDRAEHKQDTFAMIGFGGGLHKCTGMNFANNEMMVITGMLLTQFEVELITQSPSVERGLGANRPTETLIRYKRKT